MKCKVCGLDTESARPFHNTYDECIVAHNARYQILVDAAARVMAYLSIHDDQYWVCNADALRIRAIITKENEHANRN